MTQQQLGEKLGIKSQQVQKYETGANRISASRLWDIATALETDITFFFDGLAADDLVSETLEDLIPDSGALALLRSYHALSEAQRKLLLELARSLGEGAGERREPAQIGMARKKG